jgi:hypothetical protein
MRGDEALISVENVLASSISREREFRVVLPVCTTETSILGTPFSLLPWAVGRAMQIMQGLDAKDHVPRQTFEFLFLSQLSHKTRKL